MAGPQHIGYTFPPSAHVVEAGRLRFFAKATGANAPLWWDEEAARAAGYPAIPAPPTFAFCLELDRDDPLGFLNDLDIDLARILHAEQSFTYHAPLFAGDTVTFQSRVRDVYDKKDGRLTFVVIEREAHKADGTLVVTLASTLVVRNG